MAVDDLSACSLPHSQLLYNCLIVQVLSMKSYLFRRQPIPSSFQLQRQQQEVFCEQFLFCLVLLRTFLQLLSHLQLLSLLPSASSVLLWNVSSVVVQKTRTGRSTGYNLVTMSNEAENIAIYGLQLCCNST